MIYVTWRPATAEDYFLTIIMGDDLGFEVDSIMQTAHEIEELEVDSYDICSILHINGEVEVIY